MDARQEEIISKIKKLLNLAERAGSDEEAQTAMVSARRLLSKYNISMADVTAFTEEECCETHVIIKKRYIPSYIQRLVNVLAYLYSSKAIFESSVAGNINRQKITFVGVGVDPEIACQSYEFLSQFMNRKVKEFKYIGRKETDYKFGFCAKVVERCIAMMEELKTVPEETALVPIKDASISNYLDRKFPHLRAVARRGKLSRRITQEMEQGFADGNAVNLGRPIENSESSLVLPS